MIRPLKASRTEEVWNREPVRAFGPELQRAAQKKLRLTVWTYGGAEDVEITDYH